MSKKLSPSVLRVIPVLIPSGASVPGATGILDLQEYVLVGIEFPATFTGTGVTFKVNQDAGATWIPVYQGAGVLTVTKQLSTLVMLGTTFRSADGIGRYVQINSSGNEGQDSTVKAYLVPRS